MTHIIKNKAVLALAIAALGFSASALAHHGFGRFDRANDSTLTGTITGIDFVNPHSYLYFDQLTDTGETIAMRCEMRAATLMRRSGWSKECSSLACLSLFMASNTAQILALVMLRKLPWVMPLS